MKIKASGRSALILATGLFLCFAGPSQGAPGSDDADYPAASADSEDTAAAPVTPNKSAKHSSRHSKSHAHRKSGKVTVKSDTDKKTDATDVADRDSDNSSASPAIPPWVANANAHLAPMDAPTGNAKAMSARANEILQSAPDKAAAAQPAEDQVVSADQLNDVDRALHEATPPAPTFALASAEVPAAPVRPVMTAASSESSVWDQTSLIGKIFIGFGALLTMASAVRMFMA
jgi:hypothetical protein